MTDRDGEDAGVQSLHRLRSPGGERGVPERVQEGGAVLEQEPGVGPHRHVRSKQIQLTGLPQPRGLPLAAVGEDVGDGLDGEATDEDGDHLRTIEDRGANERLGSTERRTPRLKVADPVVLDVLRLSQHPHHGGHVAARVRAVEKAGPERRAPPVGVEDLQRVGIHQGDAVHPEPVDDVADGPLKPGHRVRVRAGVVRRRQRAARAVVGARRDDVVVLQVVPCVRLREERTWRWLDRRVPGERRLEVLGVELLHRRLHLRSHRGLRDLAVRGPQLPRRLDHPLGGGKREHLPSGGSEDGRDLLRLGALQSDQLVVHRLGEACPRAPVALPRDDGDRRQGQDQKGDEDARLYAEQRGLHACGHCRPDQNGRRKPIGLWS